MSRNLIYKVLGTLVVLCAAIFWLLSITMPETFGGFSLAWAGVLLCGGLGVIMLLQGLFQKNNVSIKKFKVWIGVGLIIGAILCLVSALAIPDSLVRPIIAIVLAAGLMIAVFASGGEKWDEGDNHKLGYKDYHERKKEEEKQQEKENKE